MTNRAKTAYKESVAVVMDADRNPLRSLPPVQRFQIMTILSIMWTSIFCTAIGAWFLFGELVVGHIVVLAGILITANVFNNAKNSAKTYRDYPRDDGSARYDDVWGA
ncbi:MAG: hypothetical protein AAGM33_08955 [Pseudomonadota bacterium]